MIEKFKNLFFPKTYGCLNCNRDVFDSPYLFCERCLPKLPYLAGRICLRCSEPLIGDGNYCKRCKGKKILCDKAISPFKYEGIAANLVKKLKYDGHKYVAMALGKFMAECFKQNKLFADVVTVVPLCKKRKSERGFNQAEELMTEFVKWVPINTSVDNLVRVVDTPSQTELDFAERQKNLIDAFKINNPKEFENKSVLLIDDVYTTGATTNECCKTLRLAGAKAVYVLTASHTILTTLEGEQDL